MSEQYHNTILAKDALQELLPKDKKEINFKLDGNMVTFSFSMARFEELPKALAGALNKLEHDGLVKVNKSGRFHYEALTPLEAVGHQYPHGHIPNGCDVSIAIPVKHIKTFASACSNAKVHHSLMGNAALAR